MIVALAAIGLLPPLYMVCTNQGLQGFAIKHGMVTMLSYSLAAFFYLTHLPERWWPHTFDIWVSDLSYFPTTIWMKDGKLISVSLRFAGGKPSDLSSPHRCRPGLFSFRIEGGDARTLSESGRADRFSIVTRNESIGVDRPKCCIAERISALV